MDRNPYFGCVILWICAISGSLTSCIFGIINLVLWQALVNLILVVFDCICLGWAICKCIQYDGYLRELYKFRKHMQSMSSQEKQESPFKEFDNE